MAYSLSFTTIFFFLSIVSLVLISNAGASDPYELVNKVCHEQGNINFHFCLDVLKSDESSKFAKDIATLTKIAVNAAATNSTKTRDSFQGVKTGPPAVSKSLKDCIVAYNIVITNLQVCMKEEDCDLTSYDIHAAGDEVKRCQKIADDNGDHDSIITTSNDVTLQFCWLAESLANNMCKTM